MFPVKLISERLQTIVPLQIKPYAHEEIPTITGSAISSQAGTVFYGYYNMEYKLPGNNQFPGNNSLRIFANHNKKNVQILLITDDPQKLKNLPGSRPSSLVANTINQINRYRIRSDHYQKPRTKAQIAKYQLATTCIDKLSQLLIVERELLSSDWAGQERLRENVIAILEESRGDNLLIATHPLISEGTLDTIIYEARQAAQHYQFNRVHPVSRVDQLDFSEETDNKIFVWDSELHIGQDEESLNDAIRIICKEYGLTPPASLNNIAASRFKRLEAFLKKLWLDGRDWMNHLAYPQKASPETQTETRVDGLSITTIKPYYCLDGLAQIGYSTLEDLVCGISKNPKGAHTEITSIEEATRWLVSRPNGSWVQLPSQVLLRQNDDMVIINFFKEGNLIYPLPTGEDLFTLSQLGKHHLYLPERASLQLKAFFSRLPIFFKHLFHNIKQFTRDLYQEFFKHIHQDHEPIHKTLPSNSKKTHRLSYLQEALHAHGLLTDGLTLEQFVKNELQKNNYVIVREKHRPSPPPYENPLHRFLGVLRHIGSFFVNTSEKNPILGTLAMAAYAYGAGAVIAPEALTSLLTKLHLNGLIKGIHPTQILGKWMGNGATSEAIAAAMTYWQGIVVGGDLDQFFIKAVTLVKEEPAEVAIIVSLAITLGYGLCKTIPSLEDEMGQFPYISYATLGAKGGAAIYDTVMHPGDDWLLGSIKWFLRGALNLAKLIGGPFVEAYFYGYRKGLISGLTKSRLLFVKTSKQFFAALADFCLEIITIPLLELSSLFLHVPFRGITKLISKTLAIFGNLQVFGQLLMEFAARPNGWGYLPGFRLSPLYGFSNPFGHYAENKWINIALNSLAFLFLPPLMLLKNFVILPVIDSFSFGLRCLLTFLDPVIRGFAHGIGLFLKITGIFWDNSLGALFNFTAYAITYIANQLDNIAGFIKQRMIAAIHIGRRKLYHWAFTKEEEQTLHKVNNDVEYLLDPMKLEKLPHNSTSCILNKLLNNAPYFPTENNSEHSTQFSTHPNSSQISMETNDEVIFRHSSSPSLF
ncbi:hypothetical protein [Legionella hackeliae]|uniref:Predicted archaeal membrane protein n=1 Tax=Legionella hackeliae TaxID=449 RepID=A0A0A8UR32_LEGHA|nr:hypothetical protein [Legionella hackeliae]KTD15457.1 membrane protein [Legionella hackeliae]CEK11173.1 Predicted archaeal membrane protein [Legionella hackeliae]STX47938.1 membrane protein [Legionella hackeliae]